MTTYNKLSHDLIFIHHIHATTKCFIRVYLIHRLCMLWLCGYIGKLYATVKPKVISYVKYAPVKGTSLATGITLIKTMIGKN